MREMNGEEGVNINAVNVNKLQFEYDIVLMAASQKSLQNFFGSDS